MALCTSSIVLPISLNAGPWLIPFLSLPLTRSLIDFFLHNLEVLHGKNIIINRLAL